ncbi:MAG: YggS family pyridoxal phosphate-dependent enzyme [Gammaproteobacteria bacterium]|nr:YggS family pyridoxal phosphate-dependent enzyme [Gammaproteobacteria bacterium]
MIDIAANLDVVRQRIATAAANAGRNPADVTLIAVSKTKPLALVEAALAAGQISFGENYAQELQEKSQQQAADWHFIGPLQSNKTKLIANQAQWVHSIDRLKIAQRLSDQRSAELPPLNVCIQVNISDEPQKAGVPVNEVAELAAQIKRRPNVVLRGLMCIPKPDDAGAFERMRDLFEQLNEGGCQLDCLSMGMSSDFEAAIAAGATHVRVGTAIFGSRK